MPGFYHSPRPGFKDVRWMKTSLGEVATGGNNSARTFSVHFQPMIRARTPRIKIRNPKLEIRSNLQRSNAKTEDIILNLECSRPEGATRVFAPFFGNSNQMIFFKKEGGNSLMDQLSEQRTTTLARLLKPYGDHVPKHSYLVFRLDLSNCNNYHTC